MTNITMLNDEAASIDISVSVCPDGTGYDIYDIANGFWLQTVDSLDEAEYELNNSYKIRKSFYEAGQASAYHNGGLWCQKILEVSVIVGKTQSKDI